MVLLESDAFLNELTGFFLKSKSAGAVALTMKKYDGRTKPKPRQGKPAEPEPSEYKCLLRAQLGNKKISTVINQKEVTKFSMAYASVLKANMDGLKKKDKRAAKSKSKTKAT